MLMQLCGSFIFNYEYFLFYYIGMYVCEDFAN